MLLSIEKVPATLKYRRHPANPLSPSIGWERAKLHLAGFKRFAVVCLSESSRYFGQFSV